MDALGDVLAPYSEEIAKFAGTVTCLQFLSGVFLLNDIRKQGSSDKYPPEPFLGGIVLSALSLKLGTIMGDEAMIKVNIFGAFISLVFSFAFYYFASSEFKSKLWNKFAIVAVLIMTLLAYANFEDAAKIEFRLGMLITGILLYLVGSPLLSLGDIIKNQSTEGLPFPLILAGTIVAASWATYGISIKNTVLTYQNLLLFVLSAIQLSLFAIYPSTPVSKPKIQSKRKANSKTPSPSKKKPNKKVD